MLLWLNGFSTGLSWVFRKPICLDRFKKRSLWLNWNLSQRQPHVRKDRFSSVGLFPPQKRDWSVAVMVLEQHASYTKMPKSFGLISCELHLGFSH